MFIGIGNAIGNDYRRQASDSVEIAAGDALLINPAKTRAYWDFTAIDGNEDDAISSVSDLTGNGWTLDNGAGTLTPKLGKVQVGTTFYSTLKANTQSGVKQAMKTTNACTNLLKNNVEVWILAMLTDGQNAALNILCGTADSGTRQFNIRVNANGTMGYEYAASATTFSTLTSTGAAVDDGLTGIVLIRSVFDFDADTITPYINGVAGTTTVASGNALSLWNPANFISTKGFGVGGRWDGANFVADLSSNYKQILRMAVAERLTDSEATNYSLALYNL